MMKWKIDPLHSEVSFKVKHLMITNVTGYFRKFDLELETEKDDFYAAKNIVFTADIDSIDTNSAQRDTHLKSQEFFHSEKYPHIRFEGKKFEAYGEMAKLQGDLSIRGVTKPIALDVEMGGLVKDPYGRVKAGFTVDGKVSRKDFGLEWNAMTEAGKVVVGDEIKVHAEVQLIQQ